MRPWPASIQGLSRSSVAVGRANGANTRFIATPRLGYLQTGLKHNHRHNLQIRGFTQTRLLRHVQGPQPDSYDNSNARPAVDLNHNITQEEKDDYARKLQDDKGKQIRTPWHREGSERPPVDKLDDDKGTMTKGMFLYGCEQETDEIERLNFAFLQANSSPPPLGCSNSYYP